MKPRISRIALIRTAQLLSGPQVNSAELSALPQESSRAAKNSSDSSTDCTDTKGHPHPCHQCYPWFD